MLLLNVRKNFSSDQKVFERLVLLAGDNWRFRIYLAESVVFNYKVSMFHKNPFFLLFWLVLQDQFRKLRRLPSSVAFCCCSSGCEREFNHFNKIYDPRTPDCKLNSMPYDTTNLSEEFSNSSTVSKCP